MHAVDNCSKKDLMIVHRSLSALVILSLIGLAFACGSSSNTPGPGDASIDAGDAGDGCAPRFCNCCGTQVALECSESESACQSGVCDTACQQPHPDAGASTCTAAGECKLYSDNCGNSCVCRAIGRDESPPGCDGGVVCFVDPCQGHVAACDPAMHTCAVQ